MLGLCQRPRLSAPHLPQSCIAWTGKKEESGSDPESILPEGQLPPSTREAQGQVLEGSVISDTKTSISEHILEAPGASIEASSATLLAMVPPISQQEVNED